MMEREMRTGDHEIGHRSSKHQRLHGLKRWVTQNVFYIIGAVAGGVAGYFYWKHIGCQSGTCMITSKPFNSIIYFSILGSLLTGFLGSVIQRRPNKI